MASEKNISTDVNAIEGGKIVFVPDVIATIANLAATEVDGVDSMSGSVVEGITGMLGKKSLTKGIKVDVGEENTTIDISVVVKYGYKIHEVCINIQKQVKSTIETMTGIRVAAVNVTVQSISFEKSEPKSTEAPAEEAE
ncbi:MAG: Asp23/Gls24 family envelope stress response protein [Christensenellaceae bacterium]|jgi:uncharacterized alkaline shock family protein YloU|nr:Asp23/Gls24 family envelope stress response protein [Christensenellaceae bacterium]